jgi:hypothetical protein
VWLKPLDNRSCRRWICHSDSAKWPRGTSQCAVCFVHSYTDTDIDTYSYTEFNRNTNAICNTYRYTDDHRHTDTYAQSRCNSIKFTDLYTHTESHAVNQLFTEPYLFHNTFTDAN